MAMGPIDWLSVSLVLVGPPLLESDNEVESFVSAYPTEIVVSPSLSDKGPGRRLSLDKERISVELSPERSSIKQEYPPQNNLSQFSKAVVLAFECSKSLEGIRAYGYNVELTYNQDSFPTSYEYVAKKLIPQFKPLERDLMGAMVQFRFPDEEQGKLWNIDIQPRFRRDDVSLVYCSVNLHVVGPPDPSKTVILISKVQRQAETLIRELDS